MALTIHTPQYLGDFQADETLHVFFNSFDSGGASVTITGLAVTDIEIYKNNSMTQRSSEAGYTLLDTDGIDLDGATGVHGFSVDLSDDTDADFFAIGNDYAIIVNAVTIDSQTVKFCAATFSIQNRFNSAGVGDYTHTITIRTTAGAAVSGVGVWVNSSNNRSGSVAGVKVTDTNGQITVNLAYGTYYIFANLSGYTFASASFTSAAGSVSFTKDIATVTSAGSSAFYSDSFLTRGIADVRESTDEPTNKGKYSDSRIIEHLEKSYILVLNELNRNSRTPAVAKIIKTIATGITTYAIPHTMSSIHGIYKGDDTGGKVFYGPRSKFNSLGRGIWIENQTLHIQATNLFGVGTEITIEYVPSGIARLHNGTCTIENVDGNLVKFGATPNAGILDTHHEAYTGSIYRCLGSDGTNSYLQERVITAYDETTRKATLDTPLDPIPTGDNIYYEIAPTINKGMDTVVALYAAYRIMATEGNAKRASSILKTYRNEIRNVRLTAYYSYMPDAPLDRSDSNNNRRYLRG